MYCILRVTASLDLRKTGLWKVKRLSCQSTWPTCARETRWAWSLCCFTAQSTRTSSSMVVAVDMVEVMMVVLAPSARKFSNLSKTAGCGASSPSSMQCVACALDDACCSKWRCRAVQCSVDLLVAELFGHRTHGVS